MSILEKTKKGSHKKKYEERLRGDQGELNNHRGRKEVFNDKLLQVIQ